MDRRLYSILICLLVLSISTVIPVATYAEITLPRVISSEEKSSNESVHINWMRPINKLRPFVDPDGPTGGGLDDITDWLYLMALLLIVFNPIIVAIIGAIATIIAALIGSEFLNKVVNQLPEFWQICYEEAFDLYDWDEDGR